MLQGYKTYICAALIGLSAAVHFLGYIDDATYQTLVGILAGGGLAALRSGVTNS